MLRKLLAGADKKKDDHLQQIGLARDQVERERSS